MHEREGCLFQILAFGSMPMVALISDSADQCLQGSEVRSLYADWNRRQQVLVMLRTASRCDALVVNQYFRIPLCGRSIESSTLAS
jgi:hypothetical protein